MKGMLRNPDFRNKIAAIITHKIPFREIVKGVGLIQSKQAGKVVLQPKW